jgi:hypothetical protein
MTDNNGGKTVNRGHFRPGNPGRPKGSRNKIGRLTRSILEENAEAVTRKAVEMAKAGDAAALKLVFERLHPIRRGVAVEFPLPEITTMNGVDGALAAILRAVATGKLTVDEAASLAKVVYVKVESTGLALLEKRVEELEGSRGRRSYLATAS